APHATSAAGRRGGPLRTAGGSAPAAGGGAGRRDPGGLFRPSAPRPPAEGPIRGAPGERRGPRPCCTPSDGLSSGLSWSFFVGLGSWFPPRSLVAAVNE